MTDIIIGEKYNQGPLLKGSLATASPALAALVAVVSTNAVTMLEVFGLGRWGMVAAAVLFLCLAHFFWRGRWWAGLPTLLLALAALVHFAVKFVRPLSAYLNANPLQGLGDLWQPLLMLSPSLVLSLICLGLFILLLKGMVTAARSRRRRVSLMAWGLIALWFLVLGGDWAYQSWGWQRWPDADDLVVRLCSSHSSVNAKAQQLLLQMGDKAAPSLIQALKVPDPDLDCLRQGAGRMLLNLGPTAHPALLKEVAACQPGALEVLINAADPKLARPLLEIYRGQGFACSQEFSRSLAKGIGKLDPTLKLE